MKCNQNPDATIKPVPTGFDAMRLLVLAFIMLSSGTLLAQEAKNPFPDVTIPSSDSAAVNATTSKMELVIWFMGNKQSAPVSSDLNPSTTVGKKSFINSGMKPNRTLIKSFLKKAVNYDSTLV